MRQLAVQSRIRRGGRVGIIAVALAVGAVGWRVLANEPVPKATSQPETTLAVTGGTPEQIGRYLILIGGCNDCHTPGFDQNPNVPEEDWLVGVPVGFKGPWGTTYGSNLRLTVGSLNEEGWVRMVRSRTSRPPMPWNALHSMSDSDLKALYAYIKSLGVKGERMPAALPPAEVPKTPYVVFEPVQPKDPGAR